MKPTVTLDPKAFKPVLAKLSKQNAAYTARFPGDFAGRQPVHTVYGGAHLFKSDSAKKLGELSIRALSRYAPDAVTFAQAVGMDQALAHKVYDRVVEKLKREAVEDFRLAAALDPNNEAIKSDLTKMMNFRQGKNMSVLMPTGERKPRTDEPLKEEDGVV